MAERSSGTPSLSWRDVGIVVRAVEGRRPQYLEDLLAALSTFSDRVKVAYHQPGTTYTDAYLDALDAWGRDLPWLLQFEDDVWLAPDFPELALEMLQSPQARCVGLVSFYSSRQKVSLAEAEMRPRLEVPPRPFLALPSVAFPTRLLDDHREFMEDYMRTYQPNAWDGGTRDWLRDRRLPWARALPSIVQHIDGESIVGHNPNPNRRAATYAARYGKARLKRKDPTP